MAPKKRAAPEAARTSKKKLKTLTNTDSQPISHSVTRSTTEDVPRRAALETTEILENVLSFLPPRTIFGVQRVARQWNNVIASSPALQEKMFLRLQNKTPETWMLIPNTPSDKESVTSAENNNPFRLMEVAADTKPEGWKHKWGGLGHIFTPATLNPFLCLREPFSSDTILTRAHKWVNEGVMLTRETKFAQQSSYRNTYLCDPPTKECYIRITYCASPPTAEFSLIEHYAEILSNRFLTLGDVMDKGLDTCGPCFWLVDGYGRLTTVEDATLSEKLEHLKKKHGCEVHLKDDGPILGIGLPGSVCRPLFPTEADRAAVTPIADVAEQQSQ